MTKEAERAFWVLESTESEKFPYKITIEQGDRVLLSLLVRDRWPGAKGNIFCLRAEPSEAEEPGEELERVPVINMKRYGKRLSLVLDRTKKKRCDFLFLKKAYKNGSGEYEQIFWQTQKGLTERKSKSRFAVYGTPAMHIVIDQRERYPWNFAECTTERATLPVGDYALLHERQIIAVAERKTLENMLSSLSDLRILNQSLGELETWPAPALVVEANFGDFLDPKKIRPLNVPYCTRAITELIALHPRVSVVFAGSRKQANLWTMAYFKTVRSMKEEPQKQLRVQSPAFTSMPDIPSETEKRLKEVIESLPEAFSFKELREALPDLPDQALRRSLQDLRAQGIVSCTGRGRAARWVKASRT
jgi:ERCC4-type nuclease